MTKNVEIEFMQCDGEYTQIASLHRLLQVIFEAWPQLDEARSHKGRCTHEDPPFVFG
jgi:hypothetical protein